ncbi:hypothetical protein LLG46_11465 [bacterium]|nr:hypothetical protein [bacterium]
MRCRCGNEINNVPEHLRGLANWVCQQCTNVAPKAASAPAEEKKKQTSQVQKKKAA